LCTAISKRWENPQFHRTNMTSKFGEHTTEMPEQVAQPATYKKHARPLVRLKEAVKKMIGKGARGIGLKHSRAKPSATGDVGLNLEPKVVHSGPEVYRILALDRRRASGSGTQDRAESPDRVLQRKDDLESQDELKQMDVPASLGEGAKAAYLHDRREIINKEQIQMSSDLENQRSVLGHDNPTFKDPAEGLTASVKAAFIEDQRERALLGNEKFEKGRQDRSREGAEKSMGQKILEGLQDVAHSATQTATQSLQTATKMIIGEEEPQENMKQINSIESEVNSSEVQREP